MTNLSIVSSHKILYVSTEMVSLQSVAVMCKDPGRVVNRRKNALSAWRALTKVAAELKISAQRCTKYPLDRTLTSYEHQNGNFAIACGEKKILKK